MKIRENYGIKMLQLSSKILEDRSTLLQIQKDENFSPIIAPIAYLISVFAVQPSKDIGNASRNLFRVVNQPGVQLIRQIFRVENTQSTIQNSIESHTGMLLLVKVVFKFYIRSEKNFSILLKEALKEFLKRRSMALTMIEASGCEVFPLKGERIKDALQGKRIHQGITIFRGKNGFHSKLIEPFLRLDRVPSRHFQEFHAPNLPVVHQVGTRIENNSIAVGFHNLKKGTVLIAGSESTSSIKVLQQLLGSLIDSKSIKKFVIIDSQNELNGLVKFVNQNHDYITNLDLQLFQLGRNFHLNLCDVLTPPINVKERKEESEIRAEWKSQIISDILLSSLSLSDYSSERYSIILKSHLKAIAEINTSYFTLKDIKSRMGRINEIDNFTNNSNLDMMYNDTIAIEQIIGLIDQFRSFPEINYAQFKNHFRKYLESGNCIKIFQFSSQPTLIQRAAVFYLLHYFSQIMKDACIVITNTDKFIRNHLTWNKYRNYIPSIFGESLSKLASNNLLIVSTQNIEALSINLDDFESIKNRIYLKMINPKDREIILTHHQLLFTNNKYTSVQKQQQILGIREDEGLLFREDSSFDTGFHFKLDKQRIPIDLTPIKAKEIRQKGSQILGLTPKQYQILMKLLRSLINHPIRQDKGLALLEESRQIEVLLDKFQALKLFSVKLKAATRYWIINPKGRNFYNLQIKFINQLPLPLKPNKILFVPRDLKKLESLYWISQTEIEKKKIYNKVKLLVGQLLNCLCQSPDFVPWSRVAEYWDLILDDEMIFQETKAFFDLVYTLVNNLLLEVKQSNKGKNQNLIIQNNTRMHRNDNLDENFPDNVNTDQIYNPTKLGLHRNLNTVRSER